MSGRLGRRHAARAGPIRCRSSRRPRRRACAPIAGRRLVGAPRLETTYDEVVDVVVGAGAAQPIGACLVEAVWALSLTSAFYEERKTYPLDFQ
jgi:hypothetical protein